MKFTLSMKSPDSLNYLEEELKDQYSEEEANEAIDFASEYLRYGEYLDVEFDIVTREVKVLKNRDSTESAFSRMKKRVEESLKARDIQSYAEIDPTDVEDYLKAHGWKYSNHVPPGFIEYRRGSRCVLVPVDRSFSDYARRMREALHEIVEQEMEIA